MKQVKHTVRIRDSPHRISRLVPCEVHCLWSQTLILHTYNTFVTSKKWTTSLKRTKPSHNASFIKRWFHYTVLHKLHFSCLSLSRYFVHSVSLTFSLSPVGGVAMMVMHSADVLVFSLTPLSVDGESE